MDSKPPENTNANNEIATPFDKLRARNDKGGLWQWLAQSQTRVVGIILLTLAFVLFLALMVIVSQKKATIKTTNNIPQASPTNSQSQQNVLPPIPSPKTDVTKDWITLTNTNGFKIKYPMGSQLIPSLPQASSSADLQISSDQSVLAIETNNKNDPNIKGKTLKEIVDLVRGKNATPSGKITVDKILTKPISILYGGNEGFEWYLQSNGFRGLNSDYGTIKGKNRVIEFNKNNKHYIIFSSFNDTGEKLLSTFSLNP